MAISYILTDTPKEMESMIISWLQESERGCVLIGTTIIHDELEIVLRSTMQTDTHAMKYAVKPLFKGCIGTCWKWMMSNVKLLVDAKQLAPRIA